MRRVVPFLIVALLFAGQTAAQTAPKDAIPSVVLPPALDRVLRDYEKGWRANDAAALAQLFTEDGFVLANGKPPVRGRTAIEAAYAGRGGPLVLRAFAFSIDGDVGYIIGGYAATAGADDSGKFVLALRRNKRGRWLIAADIDNTNNRPRASAAAPPAQ
jgi:ketosteroid isomerase-like protein